MLRSLILDVAISKSVHFVFVLVHVSITKTLNKLDKGSVPKWGVRNLVIAKFALSLYHSCPFFENVKILFMTLYGELFLLYSFL